MVEMTQFEDAVDQVVTDSERLHKIVNGGADETVVVEDGSTVPTVRKAMKDNLYFKTPALPWVPGTVSTVFNQLYAYKSVIGVQWWYAPGATATAPVSLPVDPTNNVNWRLYLDGATMAQIYATKDSPILTGNPQAPTPVIASNSTTIATTAFVKLAIAAALSGLTGTQLTVPALTVTGPATLASLNVSGASVLTGPVTLGGNLTGDNTNARLESLTLTKELSSVGFLYIDPLNPLSKRTRLTPYQVQTHTVDTDLITVGTVSIDDTTTAIRALGNSLFDYLYIRGNSSKPATSPRLVVDGVTRLQNLEVTGTVTGISLSVDGQTIRPQTIQTTGAVDVGGDLTVAGVTNIQNLNAEDGLFTGTLGVNGLSTLRGGFDTATGSGRVGGGLTVAGTTTLSGDVSIAGNTSSVGTLSADGLISALGGLTVTGDASVSGKLSVVGDVDLNNATGTTKIHNLEISGTVTGLDINLSQDNISVASLVSYGNVTAGGDLTVSGNTVVGNTTIGFAQFVEEGVDSSTAAWSPSGNANIYNVAVDATLTIGAWPGLADEEKPAPFQAVIYLWQDATGHPVTFDGSYAALNTETVNPAPNSVTIVNLSYCGRGTIVDMIISRRV